MRPITISVQAEPADLRSWLALAARLERGGFHGLLMGDHPRSGTSPWPALGSAAAVTATLKLGTCVVQAGVREPMHVAADAATLDVLAPGRVILGVGAGHTPREWADVGRARPGPRQRAERLAESQPDTVRSYRHPRADGRAAANPDRRAGHHKLRSPRAGRSRYGARLDLDQRVGQSQQPE